VQPVVGGSTLVVSSSALICTFKKLMNRVKRQRGHARLGADLGSTYRRTSQSVKPPFEIVTSNPGKPEACLPSASRPVDPAAAKCGDAPTATDFPPLRRESKRERCPAVGSRLHRLLYLWCSKSLRR
jgi:hypothetical protein